MIDFITSFGSILLHLFGVIAALMVIIFVHEMGHYLVGRWCGIGAAAFSIGFGPEIAGFTDKRGTRWKIAAIPLGGYVKFVGDEDPASQPEVKNTESLKGSFAAANAWRRAATVFAGPLFNAIYTVLVLAIVFFCFGREIFPPVITSVVENSPAAHAGFKPGDKILTVDGEPVDDFNNVIQYVMMRAGDSIEFTVERNRQVVPMRVVPEEVRVETTLGSAINIGRVGMAASAGPGDVLFVNYNIIESLSEGVRQSADIVKTTGVYLGRLIQGRGDRCQLSGPIQSGQIVWKVVDSGFVALLKLTALFSISIGLFNLLPIPPLDGGHLFFYLIEGVVGKPVPVYIQERVFKIGLICVLTFMVLAIVNNLIPC